MPPRRSRRCWERSHCADGRTQSWQGCPARPCKILHLLAEFQFALNALFPAARRRQRRPAGPSIQHHGRLAGASDPASHLAQLPPASLAPPPQDLMRGMAIRLASKHGLPAITFNLRGVGKSSGSPTLCGHAEVQARPLTKPNPGAAGAASRKATAAARRTWWTRRRGWSRKASTACCCCARRQGRRSEAAPWTALRR